MKIRFISYTKDVSASKELQYMFIMMNNTLTVLYIHQKAREIMQSIIFKQYIYTTNYYN